MSRCRFLANHNLNDQILHGLRRREPAIEFVTAREIGLDRAADAELLAYASNEKLILLSHDVTTMSAAATRTITSGQYMAGLFLIHQRHGLSAIIDELILIWAASEAEEWANQVWFLPL